MSRFTEDLRIASEPHWTAAVEHRFVQELAADTLDDAAFTQYLLQDYAFIGDLVSLVAFAVAYAPDMEAQKTLSGFLGVLTGDENTYFQRSFEALNLDIPGPEAVAPAPVTGQFAALIREAAATRDWGPVMAVLLAAEWSYLTWAAAADESGTPRPARFYLAEWIDLHAIAPFADFVGWLRRRVDDLGASASERERQRLNDYFSRTMALEAAFYDQAYDLAAGKP